MLQGSSKSSILRSAFVLTFAVTMVLPEALAGKLDNPFVVKEVRVHAGNRPVEIQNDAFEKTEQNRSWQERFQTTEQNAIRAAQRDLDETKAQAAEARKRRAAARAEAAPETPAAPANPSASAPTSPAAASPKQPYSISHHKENLRTQAPNLPQEKPQPPPEAAPPPKPRRVNVAGIELPFGLSDFVDETDEKFLDKKAPRRAQLKSLHSRSTGEFDADGNPVTDDIDPYSTLRNFNQIASELGDRRFEKNARWQKGGLVELGGEDRRPSGSAWDSQTEAWSRAAPSRIEMRPTFEGEVRDMKRHDMPERENRYTGASRFAGKYAEQLQKLSAANDRGLDPRYGAGSSAPIGERRYTGYANVNNLSMQDINRYQFRRSHPTTSGMPVVSPGGGDVDTTRFRPKNP